MVFTVPIYDDNPVQRTPVVTYALIGACIGVWFWQIVVGGQLAAFHYGLIPAALFGYWPPGVQPIPPWATLFTSMFLHGGWMHLISNMLFLWIFGNNIEDLLGRFRYLLLYLASGVTAALIQGLSAVSSQIPMIGASGAVAGVLGAYLITYPRANVYVFVWIILFFTIVTVPAWLLLGFWFAMQVLSGLGSMTGEPGVAFWAHVGGFVAGAGLFLMLRPRGVNILQPQHTPTWVRVPPGAMMSHRKLHRGSVPDAGHRAHRPRPWE
ncbi:MAG: rhomboid family intramembrane serine protease [Alphaproteobacteria bacterium]